MKSGRNWEQLGMKYELKDICKTNQSNYSKSDKWTFINYLDTGNITKNKIDEVQYINLENEKLPSRAKRKVEIDDIIYSTVRPNQLHYGIIKQIPNNFLVSTGFTTIKINRKIAEPKFIFYYITQDEITEHLSAIAEQSTSAYPSIKPSDIENLEIDLPSLEIQKQIASILSALDDKIELNNKINENLEQQAYLLLEQMLSIPHDDVCCLSDIANINPRYTLSKGTEARYIDMSQLSTTTSFPDGWTFRPYNGGMKFKNKDTIMARITPCLENGKTAYIDFLEGEEIAFGSTEYIVLSPKDNIPPELLYCIVRYPEFRTYATINMNGSSGRQRVSGEIIGKYEIPLFTQEELSEFGAVAEPLFKQITENSLQNRNLSALRDTLLPKLMNGEIDVSKVKI